MDAFANCRELRTFTNRTRCQWENSINQTESIHQSFTLSQITKRERGDVIYPSSSITCNSPRHFDAVNSKPFKGIAGRPRSKSKPAVDQKQERSISAPTTSIRSKPSTSDKARTPRSDQMANVTSSAVASGPASRQSSYRTDTVEDRDLTSSHSRIDFNNQGKEKSAFFIFIPGINGKALCLSQLGEPRKTVRSNTSKQNKTKRSSESSRDHREFRANEQDNNYWMGAKDSCGQRSVLSDTSIGTISTHQSRRSQSRSSRSSRTSKSPFTKSYAYDLQAPSSPSDQSEQSSFQSVRSSRDHSLKRHHFDSLEEIADFNPTPKFDLSNTSQEYFFNEMNNPSCKNNQDTLRKESPLKPYHQHSFKSENGIYTKSSLGPRNHSRKTTVQSTFTTLQSPPSPSTRSLPNFRESCDRSERSCASACSARGPLRYNSPKDDKFKYMMAQLRLDREKADKERQAVLKLKQNLHREGSYRKVQKYLTKISKGSISVTPEHTTPKLSPQGLLLGVD